VATAPTIETKPTMESTADHNQQRFTLPAPLSFHKGLLENVSDGSNHPIKSFLARPAVIYKGAWTTSQGVNTVIKSISLPEDILAAIPTFSQKIYGFLGFRARTVITLQVNTNRFQQGRLMMTYFPNDKIAKQKYMTSSYNLIQRTQLPRAEFDAAVDSEITFAIPYVSPYLAFDTTNGVGHQGVVDLTVYSPLDCNTTEIDAECTVWAHFEDVELMFPAISGPSVTQSFASKRKMKSRYGDPAVSEENSNGWISRPLDKISKAAAIAAEVPLLSSIAGPVSWFSAAAANAASAFGLSNPLSAGQTQVVVQRPMARLNNASGGDNSINLGVLENNQLEHLPGFAGQDVDEMALAYPLSIPTYLFALKWDSTQLVDTPLLTYSIVPNNLMAQTHISGGYNCTPIAFFSKFFQLYRGGIKVKMKFVKTEFHSGRLVVAYSPGYVGAVKPSVSTGNVAYLHRSVIDMRETTEFEFTLPYVSTTPYKSVMEECGQLNIFVLNTLRNPDTVRNYVTILLEFSAAEDFEFANLSGVKQNEAVWIPHLIGNNSTTQAFASSKKLKSRYSQKQSLISNAHLETSTMDTNEPDGLGTSKNLVDNAELANRYCTGESIKSVRQIIKRSTPFTTVDMNGQEFFLFKIYPWLVCLPFYNGDSNTWIRDNSSSNLSTTVPIFTDLYATMASCYAYQRGGIRLKSYFLNYSNWNSTARASWNGDISVGLKWSVTKGATTTDLTYPSYNYSLIPSSHTTYPFMELQAPYINKTHMQSIVNDTGSQSQALPYVPTRVTSTVTYTARKVPDVFVIERQASEDVSFGFWTGCPMMVNAVGMTTPPTNTSIY